MKSDTVGSYIMPENTIGTVPTDNEIHFVLRRQDGSYIQPRTMQHYSMVIRRDIFPAFDFHSLRHTHCTMLIERGCDEKYVQHRLGHKKLSVTQDVYTHLTDGMRSRSVSKLNEIYAADKEQDDTKKSS